MKKIILVMFLLVSSLGFAKWEYKEEKDPFTDKVKKEISLKNNKGFLILSNESEKIYSMGLIALNKTYTYGTLKKDIEIRIDNNETIVTDCLVSESSFIFPLGNAEIYKKITEEMQNGKKLILRVQDLKETLFLEFDLEDFASVYQKIK